MNNSINKVNVAKFAGAFIAFIIGSGFATGQEIMQFFTSNGLYSIGSIIISLVLFTYFGSTVMTSGFEYRRMKNHKPYKYFCGNIIGTFYEYFVPVLLFTSVVIMISGSGATLQEYYGLNYFVGCAIMAILVLIAYVGGLDSLINTIGLIGPIIVMFSLIVGIVILFQNLDGLANISQTVNNINMHKAGGNWFRSGIVYAAYNMVGGVMFFTTLGENADERREAKYGAIVGSVVLMFVILVVNLALLSKLDEIHKLSIPTLYFAKSISPLFGKIFSVVLLCGIFSTAAPNFWTVCNRISKEGSKKSRAIAVILAICAFLGGLLPFEKLVGKVYPYTGVFGVILFTCIIYKQISKRII